ncbi:DNA repair exonuclease [Petroclostridium sp. X23]|uniref:metallophosphoesterase family protein n=1 Tax=Petroclostridium sp. X23 TaxID=3045146 RepID=UPI0024ACEEED|nr:DNA repair exonuclease [Petroclostridium sp. X23]WHH57349.1 DNA repair exonuclease [Petroclostridium sp. X23]
MESISFIHCGDIHLDAKFTSTGLTEMKAKQRRQEIQDAFIAIINKVIELDVQILLIAGDLFEHEYISKNTAEFIQRQLERIPKVRIFISPGNHDPYTVNSYYSILDWPTNVHIFKSTMEKVELTEYNMAVYGGAFSNKYRYESILDEIKDIDKSKINILLTHGTLDIGSSECPYHPISSSQIKELGFDYAALGHIHKMSGEDVVNDSRVGYCGSPEPMGFDEPGKHGVIYGKISDNGVRFQTIALSKRQCITQEVDISGAINMNEIEEHVKKLLENMNDDLVRIVLTGKKAKELDIDVQLITSRLADWCFYLKVVDHTCPDYPLDDLRKQQNLKGVFVRKLLNEIDMEQDEQRRNLLYKALYLGLDALN